MKNTRSGQAMMQWILLTGVVAALGASSPSLVSMLNAENRRARVKTLMIKLETSVRTVLLRSDSFYGLVPKSGIFTVNTYTGLTNACATAPYTNCELWPDATIGHFVGPKFGGPLINPPYLPPAPSEATKSISAGTPLTFIRTPLLFTTCPAAIPGCGIRVRYMAMCRSTAGAGAGTCPDLRVVVPVTNPIAMPFPYVEFQIIYEGTDVNIAARTVRVNLPTDLSTSSCPTAALPIFKGVNPITGAANCQALPADCPRGQVMVGINWSASNTALICSAGGALPSCPPGKFVTKVDWTTGGIPKITCGGTRYDKIWDYTR